MAEPVEASSLYSGAPLLSCGFGVQFNVGDFLRPVYAEDFPEMSSFEIIDCIFQFFGEGPQFAVVEENTCNICIESSDVNCGADFSAVNNFIQCFESIYCKNFSTVGVLSWFWVRCWFFCCQTCYSMFWKHLLQEFFNGWCHFPCLADSPVTWISSTSRYLVGLFHNRLSLIRWSPYCVLRGLVVLSLWCMLSFVWLWLPNLHHLHIWDQFRNSFLFQPFCSSHDRCILRVRYFHTVLQRRSYVLCILC